ncbi:hypothetical protein PHYPSEUDO_010933 [Phytophthora pseudosyringae]|uniref:Uncharacterized protein n=1 Tax=Phytophthora pseudosyringae TaxID=221518 RepID=A0A8T1V955_9STRA|nr:hypothetical protein PHYPSEUDO_010933 [Phytophthora pseudosyringae]
MDAHGRVSPSEDESMTDGVKCSGPADSVVKVKSEPLPEPSGGKPPASATLKLKLVPPDTKQEKEVELTPEQFKKRRCNERDRRRSCAKRETMEQVRRTVAALELQEQQLMQRITGDSPCSDENRSLPSTWPDLVVSTAPSLYPSPLTPVTHDGYVQFANEIEEFWRQNVAMAQALARRDLFNNSRHYRLKSFPPLDSRSGMQPAQLTHEEGVTTCGKSSSEERFRNRSTFLGWSQHSEHQGEVVTFGVKKALWNVSPQQLMDRSWQFQTNDGNRRRLGLSHLSTCSSATQAK